MSVKTTRFIRGLTVVGLLALVPLLAACAKSVPAVSGGTTPVSATAAATVKLLEPTQGAEVPAGTVRVRVETTGLAFTMPSNTNADGQGHVHFTLDEQPFVMSTEPQAEIKGVAPGPHTLKAELVQNDTRPFNPPVEQVIEFTTK
jgi:hypothetical protein